MENIGPAKAKIRATVQPSNATDKLVEWSTSNKDVATVDQEGNVVILKKGLATISARCSGFVATCEIISAYSWNEPEKVDLGLPSGTLWASFNLGAWEPEEIGAYFAWGVQIGLSAGFLLTSFLLYIFCTAISISAVVFVLLSEMYPNRVRGLAMSIAGLALWVGTYLIGQLTPWMLEYLTPAGTFFFFAFMCLPYLYIMWKYVPDTTGKTLEEIEEYWKK